MGFIPGLMVGIWVFYTYHKYAETKQVFYPVTGFLVACVYGALMMAGPTAALVLGTL